VGSSGQERTKTFASEAVAVADAARLVAEKRATGWS
jgi:predicted DNA-binding WGR domain protein